MSSSFKLALTACSALVIFSQPVLAGNKDDRIDHLEAQLQALAMELRALKAERQADKIAVEQQINEAVATVVQGIEPASGDDVKISFKHGPKIESADGHYSFQPIGRAHLDVTQFNDDNSDQPNNINLRRARIGAKGNMGEDFKYKAEFGFSEDKADIEDVHITYSGLKGVNLRMGHQRPSFGFDANTSSNIIQFLERAAPSDAFAQSQRLGLNVFGGGDHWSLAGGVFGESAGNSDPSDDEGVSYDVNASTNILGLFDSETQNVVHLGAGYSHRRPTDDVDFSFKPTGDSPDVIDTGDITGVDSVDVIGLELASIFGPFTFQSEYFTAEVSRDSAFDADFDGYYAQAGWIITGETRPYNGSSGKVGRIKPQTPFSLKNGGWGAWEILARYEHVDLNDRDAGILGGELDNTTIGLNWYLNNHSRLLFNYISVDTDDNAVVADDDPSIFNMRLQWDF